MVFGGDYRVYIAGSVIIVTFAMNSIDICSYLVLLLRQLNDTYRLTAHKQIEILTNQSSELGATASQV
jgi:hypothetical protein